MFLKLQSFAHSMLRNMKNAIITIYGLMNYINFQPIAKRNKHAYIYCCDDIVCAFQTFNIVPAISIQQGSCKGLLPIIKISGEKDSRIKKFL
jgi:hypothetical protein